MMQEGAIVNSEGVEAAKYLLEQDGLHPWSTKFIVNLKSLDEEEVVGRREQLILQDPFLVLEILNSGDSAILFFLGLLSWNSQEHFLPSFDDHHELSFMENVINEQLHGLSLEYHI